MSDQETNGQKPTRSIIDLNYAILHVSRSYQGHKELTHIRVFTPTEFNDEDGQIIPGQTIYLNASSVKVLRDALNDEQLPGERLGKGDG